MGHANAVTYIHPGIVRPAMSQNLGHTLEDFYFDRPTATADDAGNPAHGRRSFFLGYGSIVGGIDQDPKREC